MPAEFRGYLIFTVVTNPYERTKSGWSFEPVTKYPHDPPRPKSFAESMERRIAERHRTGTGAQLQKEFVERSSASLVLYYERLPQCLSELPFVDRGNIPPFPHNNLGGYRPPEGGFFDHFTMEDEKLVWESEREDFEAFGYRRWDAGHPEDAPNALWMR